MEIMDHDRFQLWIECEQGLKWSIILIAGPGSKEKWTIIFIYTPRDFPFVWTVHSIRP